MKKTSDPPLRLTSIHRLDRKGSGFGRSEASDLQKEIFVSVPKTLPGEKVLAEIGSKKRGIYQGRLREVVEPAAERVPFRCAHAPVCGGCALQQMDYRAQLARKEKFVRDLFAFAPDAVFSPIAGAEDPWYYRNKMEYSFSQDKEKNRFLGLMGSFGKGRVESILRCHLCPDWFNEVCAKVRGWWEESDLSAYHPYRDTGALQTLTLREGRRTGEKMVVLTVSGNPEFAVHRKALSRFVECVLEGIGIAPPEKTSVFLRIRQAVPGRPTSFYEMLLFGKDHITEEMEIKSGGKLRTYRFTISPTAFFQPNTLQAETIYSTALETAGERKRKLILDLYAGTACLGIVFASIADRVVSVEINPYAVFDARSNVEKNGIRNLEVLDGDVASVVNTLHRTDPNFAVPDLTVVDPPRAGLGAEALRVLLGLGSKEILYISCSPESQAEECKKLSEGGYEAEKIQPVDQFPHTPHVENIVFLRRRP